MLLAGREPDDIAGTYLLDRSTLALHPAEAGEDEQRLTERVGVPGGPSSRLERDGGAPDARVARAVERSIDPDRSR
jgi:hypothetical protein